MQKVHNKVILYTELTVELL